jgi:hypothetical protein
VTVDSKAKVFVLIPEKSNNALVIRRGPAKHVGIFSWNLKTNRISVAQWLKGRIYEYRSDLSPDGSLLMYSANKNGFSFTVISKAPWLKALSLWKNVGGCGGGLLINNKDYMLFDGSESYNELRAAKLTGIASDKRLYRNGTYPERLRRFGWDLQEEKKEQLVFSKRLGKNSKIEKLWHRWQLTSGTNTPSEWESHRLTLHDVTLEMESWEWCEVFQGSLLWSENGCLFKAPIKNFSDIKTVELIYDFNDEKIQLLDAPY